MVERSDGIVFEMQRLQNTVKSKDRELEGLHRDITALKSSVAAKERLLQQKALECDRSRERCLKAETDAASSNKQLGMLKADQRKLTSQVADLQRANAKLSEKVAILSNKGPGFSEQVAALQADLKMAKQEVAKVTEDNKAANNQVRAKDRELTAALAKLDWAKQVEVTNKTLENNLAAVGKQLADAQAEIKTLQQVQRQKEADIAALTRALDKTKSEKESTEETLQRKEAELKSERANSAQLTSELQLTRDELTRVSSVASRVAASENKAGIKAEGTIAVSQHVEEVKYLGGEVMRLKDKVALLERDLGVAHQLKERYRQVLGANNLPTDLEGTEKTARRRSSIGGLQAAVVAGGRGVELDLEPSADKVQQQAIAEVTALPADVAVDMSKLSLASSGKDAAVKAEPDTGSQAQDQSTGMEVDEQPQQQAVGSEEQHEEEEGEEEEEGQASQKDQKGGRKKRGGKSGSKAAAAAAAGDAAAAAATRRSSRRKKDQQAEAVEAV